VREHVQVGRPSFAAAREALRGKRCILVSGGSSSSSSGGGGGGGGGSSSSGGGGGGTESVTDGVAVGGGAAAGGGGASGGAAGGAEAWMFVAAEAVALQCRGDLGPALFALPEELRKRQRLFEELGGLSDVSRTLCYVSLCYASQIIILCMSRTFILYLSEVCMSYISDEYVSQKAIRVWLNLAARRRRRGSNGFPCTVCVLAQRACLDWRAARLSRRV
jgi:hypothetical protein